MRTHPRFAPAVIVSLTAVLALGAAPPQTQPSSLPSRWRTLDDQANFALYQNEEKLMTMRSRLAGGNYDGLSTLSLAGQTATWKTKVTADADGRWTRLELDLPQGPVSYERHDRRLTRSNQGRTSTEQVTGELAIFANRDPMLMSWAVLHYDRARGGAQKFQAIIPSSGIVAASLEYKDTVQRSIASGDVRFDRYIYRVPDLELTLWADADGRVYLGEIPAKHLAFIREGYEVLRRSEQDDPKLSQPQYEMTIQSNLGVPMRDGVKLATDLYRPVTETRVPLVLLRTPYKKEIMELQGKYYARRGYAVAVQDCRGRFSSPGTWEPFVNEPQDGHDTIEWLAAQSWCTGKVGMIGASYGGWVQWWAASQHPPHLVTIIPSVSPPDPFYNLPYEYGVFFLQDALWWADVLESNATGDVSGQAFAKVNQKKYDQVLRALPVVDLDKAVLGRENVYWRKWIGHPNNDAYWAQANFLDQLKDVDIPVFHQSGWFDGDGIGTKLNYAAMHAAGHKHQKLVLGPWGHTDQAMRSWGTRDFGEAALIDLQRAYLRWFDHWLKDIDNGIDREALVSVFVINSNQWLQGDEYPLPQTRFTRWYLHSGGRANTSAGDGKFNSQPPAADEKPDQYTYDPGDPTLAPYFPMEGDAEPARSRTAPAGIWQAAKRVFAQAATQPATRPALPPAEADPASRYHALIIANRPDILVYVSEPLSAPLTIAGPLSAVIYASSSARDTDWFVRLAEVDGKGSILHLVEGRLRARFRNSMSRPLLLNPGEICEFKLDLWQTGITIMPGRHLCVEIASAAFPLFSRNLNTGGHSETETAFVAAQQTIYHDPEHPSHLLLPVIPAGE